MLLPNIYLHSLFLMKLHPFPLLLLLYLAFTACLELAFPFFKKGVYLIGFFYFSFKESIDFGTSRKIILCKTTRKLTGWILLHFSVLLEIDEKNHAFSMW